MVIPFGWYTLYSGYLLVIWPNGITYTYHNLSKYCVLLSLFDCHNNHTINYYCIVHICVYGIRTWITFSLLMHHNQIIYIMNQIHASHILSGHTHAKPFLLGKRAPILGPGKQVAAHVRDSKIPAQAQGLHSTCAGAPAVQKGQLEVCPFQVDRNYVLNL